MALESNFRYIADLNVANPTASDPKSQGDDHIRGVKNVLVNQLGTLSSTILTATGTEVNYLSGVTSAIQTQLNTKAPTASPTFTGTVTLPATGSGAQEAVTKTYADTALALKANLASPTFTGTVTVPTPSASTAAATKGYADGLAFSTALPAQTGNAGKFVTTDGSIASWADAKISNVVTATTATTLTATGTILQITPASYGVAVTLPDATTCTEGGPLHIIDNRGAYPVKVLNSAGTLIGFIYGGVVSHISLNDNSTAAGTWAVENSELVGASAQLLTTAFTALKETASASIALDANREIIFGYSGSSNCAAVVYDKSTNTFGTPTVIRTGGTLSQQAFILASTDTVLHCSVISGGTAFEAVVLSISGTTITVNTAATATLSANISAFADGCGLIQVGSSFVTSYTVATPAAQIRALSISGTTVTIGAASVLDGAAGGVQAASGSIVLVTSNTAPNWWVCPYTVSGSTLTVGTKATTATGTTLHKFFPLGTRWVALTGDGTNVYGHVVTLSGTTATLSSILVVANTLQDAIVVGSNKVLVLNNQATNNANILTDTAGTASAGTAITLSSQTTRSCLYTSGTDAYVIGSGSGYNLHKVDCSGASPVLTSTQLARNETAISGSAAASNSLLIRAANSAWASTSQYLISGKTTAAAGAYYSAIRAVLMPEMPRPFESGTGYRGKADSERWVTDAATVITKMECVL